ncbi:MAG: hypothetical protein LLG44_08515 [Chloroflexi bacterium]|nr:hypothetical protein [Chloroflexota bacterium]
MHSFSKTAALVLLVILLVTGCSLPADASAPTAAPTTSQANTAVATQPAATAVSPAADTPTAAGWQADGVVSSGEYTNDGTAGPMSIYWSNDDTYLYVALQANTTAWLAIGFGPERTHVGANIIIGAVANGGLELLDSYGTSERGAFHTADTDLGGTNNIVASAGVYADGVTTIEFQIPLNSGDQYDKELQPGDTVNIILAVGSTSDLTSMHSYATFGTMTLD